MYVRKGHSSNKDLKVLSQLTNCAKFDKVNRGSDAESIQTNSAHLARVIEKAKAECESGAAVKI